MTKILADPQKIELMAASLYNISNSMNKLVDRTYKASQDVEVSGNDTLSNSKNQLKTFASRIKNYNIMFESASTQVYDCVDELSIQENKIINYSLDEKVNADIINNIDHIADPIGDVKDIVGLLGIISETNWAIPGVIGNVLNNASMLVDGYNIADDLLNHIVTGNLQGAASDLWNFTEKNLPTLMHDAAIGIYAMHGIKVIGRIVPSIYEYKLYYDYAKSVGENIDEHITQKIQSGEAIEPSDVIKLGVESFTDFGVKEAYNILDGTSKVAQALGINWDFEASIKGANSKGIGGVEGANLMFSEFGQAIGLNDAINGTLNAVDNVANSAANAVTGAVNVVGNTFGAVGNLLFGH